METPNLRLALARPAGAFFVARRKVRLSLKAHMMGSPSGYFLRGGDLGLMSPKNGPIESAASRASLPSTMIFRVAPNQSSPSRTAS